VNRRTFLCGLSLGTLAVQLAVEAQQPETPARIAIVFGVSPLATMVGPVPAHPYVRALLGGLRDLGYVEGQNIVIERRSLEGNYDRAPEIVAELIRHKVQVIVAAPADVARAARRVTTTLPIVVGDATDEGEDPLIASPARPGGNVTGMGQPPPELSQKRLEVFKEAVPGISRVVVLTDGAPQQASAIRDLEAAARVLRLSLSSGGDQQRRSCRCRSRSSASPTSARADGQRRGPAVRRAPSYRRVCAAAKAADDFGLTASLLRKVP
jgi:ABC transporter substrate binding protein